MAHTFNSSSLHPFIQQLTQQALEHRRQQAALILAIALHLVFFSLLPTLPPFTIPAIKGESRITVFLNQNISQQQLEQRLGETSEFQQNQRQKQDVQTRQHADQEQKLNQTSASSQQQTQQIPDTQQDQHRRTPPSTVKPNTRKNPQSIFSAAVIREFAREEAQRYFAKDNRQYLRFKRSFNNRNLSRQQRQLASYKSLYGDQYKRSNNSGGDICFVQKPEVSPDEWVTNSVLFYRCNTKPKSLELFTKDNPQ